MSARDRRRTLAGIDARVLPAVAGMLRRIGRAVLVVAGPEGWVGRWIAPLVRREPVVAVALVSVAAAGVLLAVTDSNQRHATPRPLSASGPKLADPQRLGPAPGAEVSSYLAAASAQRQALDNVSSATRTGALVDLTGYITPSAVDALLASTPGVELLRGFARVPPPADGLIHVLTTSTKVDLAAGLAAAHTAASEIALHYESELSRSLVHPSTHLQEELQAGAEQAAAARVDATGLDAGCGCVFALLVEGPVSQLLQLAGSAAVRVLDPAPPQVSLAALMVVPLEPQVTTTVPALEFAGD